MANIPDAGSTAVYIGFWTDHDGRYLLTLSDRNAAALLSFLAVAVTFAANRSWKIFRFAAYNALSMRNKIHQDPSTWPPAVQVVLRNLSTAGSTLWSLLEIARRRRKAMKISQGLLPAPEVTATLPKRVIVLSLISVVHILGFLGAGVLTSRVLTGRLVVSRAVESCGQWEARRITGVDFAAYQSSEMFTWQSLALNNTLDSDNYVRNCYPLGVSRDILNCKKFFTRHLPYQIEHNVKCPYENQLCANRPNGAIALDSGLISFRDLGINSKWAASLSMQRRSICAVIPDTPFLEEVNDGLSRSYRFFLYPIKEYPALWFINDTISGTFNLLAHRLAYEPANITRLLRPKTSDHSGSLILLRSNGVHYTRTFDDPWFSVRTPRFDDGSPGVVPTGYIHYQADNFLNIISCKESLRFCSTLSDECTAWAPIINTNITKAWSDVAALTPPEVQTGTSDWAEITSLYQFVSAVAMWTSIPDSIGERPASSALQAARYLYGNVQAHLEPEQWKLELEYWFAMALARLQLEVFNTIEKPPGVNESIAHNRWEDTKLKDLCGGIKFYSPNHTTLSTVGIIVILVVVALLTIGSAVDVVLGWIPMDWARKIAKEWDALENLSLLENAERWRAENGHCSTVIMMNGKGRT